MSEKLIVEAPPRFLILENKLPSEVDAMSTDESIARSFGHVLGEPVAVQREGNRVKVLEFIVTSDYFDTEKPHLIRFEEMRNELEGMTNDYACRAGRLTADDLHRKGVRRSIVDLHIAATNFLSRVHQQIHGMY